MGHQSQHYLLVLANMLYWFSTAVLLAFAHADDDSAMMQMNKANSTSQLKTETQGRMCKSEGIPEGCDCQYWWGPDICAGQYDNPEPCCACCMGWCDKTPAAKGCDDCSWKDDPQACDWGSGAKCEDPKNKNLRECDDTCCWNKCCFGGGKTFSPPTK